MFKAIRSNLLQNMFDEQIGRYIKEDTKQQKLARVAYNIKERPYFFFTSCFITSKSRTYNMSFSEF
jgi:hypothetical protein